MAGASVALYLLVKIEALVVTATTALGVITAFTAYRGDVAQKAKCLGVAVVTLGQTKSACDASAPAAPSGATPPAPAPVSEGIVCSREGKCTGGSCFAPGTLVMTPHGAAPIETIQVGETVIAPSPEPHAAAAATESHRVVRVIHTPDQPLARLVVEANAGTREALLVTPNHPFWVTGRGWVSVASLAPSDALGEHGELHVASIAMTDRTSDVWNLEVEGAHTYLVGASGALVHNDCGPDAKKLVDQGAQLDKQCSELQKARLQEAEQWRKFTMPQSGLGYGSSIPSGGPYGGGGSGMSGYGSGSGMSGNGSYGGGGGSGFGGYGMPAGGLPRPTVAPNAHAFSDDTLAKLARAQGDWYEKARAVLLDPNVKAEDKSALAKAVADKMAAGACPGTKNGPGFYSQNPNIQREVQRAENAANGAKSATIDWAKTPGGKDVRPAVRENVCSRDGVIAVNDVQDYLRAQFKKEYQRRISAALEKGLAETKDSGNLKRLTQLIFIREQAKTDPRWSKYVDHDGLERLIRILENDSYVQKQLKELTDDSDRGARSSALERYQGRVDYIRSKAFDDYLALHDEADRPAIVVSQIAPIAAIDAATAQRLTEELVARQIAQTVMSMPQAELEAHLGEAIEGMVEGPAAKDAKYVSDASKRVSKAAAAAVAAGRPQDAAKAVGAEIAAMKPEQATRFGRVLKFFEAFDKNGHTSVGATAIGMFLLASEANAGRAFKDRAATLESLATLVKATDAEQYFKFGAWTLRNALQAPSIVAPDTKAATVAAGKATGTAKFLLRAKFLGPLGDAIVIGSLNEKMKKGLELGNSHTVDMNCGKHLSTVVGLGAASYLASMGVIGAATGPAAPIVWLVATGSYVGFSLFDDTNEETILRKLGVHKDNAKK